MLLIKAFISSLILLIVLVVLTRLVGIENTIVDYIILFSCACLAIASKRFRQYHLLLKTLWVVCCGVVFYYSSFWIIWVVFNNAI
jgi:hypothetical protein